MKDLNTPNEFRDVPADYQRSLQWLRAICGRAGRAYFNGSAERKRELMADISALTAHSARVTLLDAAVHARRSAEEIGLQANWKNPAPMVLKYTRNHSSVPAEMVQQLVKEMAENLHPVEATEEIDLESSAALDEVQFFLKKHSGRLSQEYRYHCSAYDDSSAIACGRLTVDECDVMGSELPEVAILCKHCVRARPDVASRALQVKGS